jgi:hypothetical protein
VTLPGNAAHPSCPSHRDRQRREWIPESLQADDGEVHALQDALKTLGPSIEAAARTVSEDWLARVVRKRASGNQSVVKAGKERGVANAI